MLQSCQHRMSIPAAENATAACDFARKSGTIIAGLGRRSCSLDPEYVMSSCSMYVCMYVPLRSQLKVVRAHKPRSWLHQVPAAIYSHRPSLKLLRIK